MYDFSCICFMYLLYKNKSVKSRLSYKNKPKMRKVKRKTYIYNRECKTRREVIQIQQNRCLNYHICLLIYHSMPVNKDYGQLNCTSFRTYGVH